MDLAQAVSEPVPLEERRTARSQSRALRSSQWSAVTATVQGELAAVTRRVSRAAGRHSERFLITMFSRVIGVSQVLYCVLGSVKRHQGRHLFDQRLQVYRPAPDVLDIGQRIGGL